MSLQSGHLDRHTDTHTWSTSCEDEGRDQGDASTGEETPTVTSTPPAAPGETWIRSSLPASERSPSADSLNSLPASRQSTCLLRPLRAWDFVKAILANNAEAAQREERAEPPSALLSYLGSSGNVWKWGVSTKQGRPSLGGPGQLWSDPRVRRLIRLQPQLGPRN